MGVASRPTSRAMFGGFGLFNGPSMFGIIYGGVLYLKQAADQSGAGTRPFKPRPSQTLWSFREVSAEVIEDRIVLQRRVAHAIEAALAATQNRGHTKAIDRAHP
jgi:DNA transformation protein and related proteins